MRYVLRKRDIVEDAKAMFRPRSGAWLARQIETARARALRQQDALLHSFIYVISPRPFGTGPVAGLARAKREMLARFAARLVKPSVRTSGPSGGRTFHFSHTYVRADGSLGGAGRKGVGLAGNGAGTRAAGSRGLPTASPLVCDMHETRTAWFMASSLMEEIERGRFPADVLAGDDGHAIKRGIEWLAIETACALARKPAQNEQDLFFKLWHERDWRKETRLARAAEVADLHSTMIDADCARMVIDRVAFTAKCVKAFSENGLTF